MKRLRKLSVAIIVLAMCILLGSTAWAAETDVSVICEAVTVCPSAEAQTVTLTFKADREIDIVALTAVIDVPDGWKVTGIANGKFDAKTDDSWGLIDASTGDANISWSSDDITNVNTDVLAVVTVRIPAGATSECVEFTVVDMAYAEYDGKDLVDIVKYSTPGPESVNVNIGHSYTGDYKDNGDGTHSQKCVNGCDGYSGAVEHDYTDGKCVCGAVELTVTYKGAALANAFTVDGNVITVTFDKACKLGYWDAENNKYVAIAATHVEGNTYTFTAPEGVTEVLLVVKGDANANGALDSGDMTRIKAVLMGKTSLTAEGSFAADANASGVHDSGDMTRIKAVLMGKTSLTWG